MNVLVLGTLVAALLGGCATLPPSDYLVAGNSYARDGLWKEAASSYRKALSLDANNLAAHRNLGIVLVNLSDYKGAIRHLEKCMGLYADQAEANFYLGEAYRGEEKFAKAIYHYQRALYLQPEQVQALKALAWSYYRIRFFSETLTTIQRLREIDPKDEQAKIIMVRALIELRRFSDALKQIKVARREASKSSLPYLDSLEGDVSWELGRTRDAKRLYLAALKVQPLLAGSLFGLGRCLMREGDSDAALVHLEKAVRIRPKLTEAHLLLGQIYESRNQEKAMKYYQYFYRQAASDPAFLSQVGEVKKRISALRSRRSTASRVGQ